jgi:hypothetical protein
MAFPGTQTGSGKQACTEAAIAARSSAAMSVDSFAPCGQRLADMRLTGVAQRLREPGRNGPITLRAPPQRSMRPDRAPLRRPAELPR